MSLKRSNKIYVQRYHFDTSSHEVDNTEKLKLLIMKLFSFHLQNYLLKSNVKKGIFLQNELLVQNVLLKKNWLIKFSVE